MSKAELIEKMMDLQNESMDLILKILSEGETTENLKAQANLLERLLAIQGAESQDAKITRELLEKDLAGIKQRIATH